MPSKLLDNDDSGLIVGLKRWLDWAVETHGYHRVGRVETKYGPVFVIEKFRNFNEYGVYGPHWHVCWAARNMRSQEMEMSPLSTQARRLDMALSEATGALKARNEVYREV